MQLARQGPFAPKSLPTGTLPSLLILQCPKSYRRPMEIPRRLKGRNGIRWMKYVVYLPFPVLEILTNTVHSGLSSGFITKPGKQVRVNVIPLTYRRKKGYLQHGRRTKHCTGRES